MSTLTTNYSLIKPGVNDAVDQDLWGGQLNDDLDSLDTLLKTATDRVKRNVSGTDTVLITDSNKMILCDATSAPFTETLIAAATAGDGFSIIIVKSDSSGNAVTVDGDGSETISGSATHVLSGEGDAVTLVCDGSNWFISGSKVEATAVADASTSTKGIVQLATTAEMQTGTDSAKTPTPAAIKGALGFSNLFTSSEQSFTFSSGKALAHSLGAIPTMVSLELVCKTSDAGFAIGDRISYDGSGISFSDGLSLYYSITQVGYSIASIEVIGKTSFSTIAITPSSWRIVLRAWA